MGGLDVREIAASFWRRAGSPSSFPRDIEASVLWALPVAVVKLPRLRVAAIREWLSEYDFQAIIPAARRELRACVVASRGRGVIFIDGCDEAEEQRLSLAHEVAHFLIDYLLPRDRALQAFGPSIVPVIDGDRPPTHAERLSAVLRGVTLGVYSRLWPREPRRQAPDARVVAHEDMADVLALELVAPRREVVARAGDLIRQSRRDEVSFLLQSQFGLPMPTADVYAGVLCASAKPAQSVRDWLGIE